MVVDSWNKSPYGTFYLKNDNFFIFIFKCIRSLGLCRGGMRKLLAKELIKKGYSVIDAEVYGIKHRLLVSLNATDEKILTSSKIYDKFELEFLSTALHSVRNASSSVFVDIGANTGYYSLNMAKIGFQKVFAVEPNPYTLGILNFNIKINSFCDKITPIPFCIGSGEDILLFFSGDLGSVSVFAKNNSSESVKVKTCSLLKIIEDQKIDRIDAMKIDIEGFEDRCLVPFFERAQPEIWPRRIVIEYCNSELWETDIVGKMLQIGYEISGKTRGNILLSLK